MLRATVNSLVLTLLPTLSWGLEEAEAQEGTYEFLFSVGACHTCDGEFGRRFRVAMGSADRTIVADTLNHRIQVFDSSGGFLFKFGSWGRVRPGRDDPVSREDPRCLR